jgi:hypothetical protein
MGPNGVFTYEGVVTQIRATTSVMSALIFHIWEEI